MIRIIEYTQIEKDEHLTSLFSPEPETDPSVVNDVRDIIKDVRARGDQAVLDYTFRYDGKKLKSLEPVSLDELRRLHAKVNTSFLRALEEAIGNVREFHSLQLRDTIAMGGKADGGVFVGDWLQRWQ